MVNPLTRFGLTELEIDAAMASDPKVFAAGEALAHRVEASLKAKAPVFGESGREEHREAPPDGEPGEFRDSIHTEPFRKKSGLPAWRVGSSSPIALWQELGTRHFPELAIFAQVAAEFGDTTGPVFSEGVQHAQGRLREALETLAAARGAQAISEAKRGVGQARQARSSAFKAGRPRRGRRSR